MSNTVIIGGGVIGLTTAYYLAKSGVNNITILEAGDTVASGASGVNGAQLCYRYISPMRARALLRYFPVFLKGDDPRLYLKSLTDWQFYRWALRAFTSGIGQAYDKKVEDVVALAEESRRLIRQFTKDESILFDYQENGKLHLFNTVEGQEAYRRSLKEIGTTEEHYQILDRDAALVFDPFLDNYQASIAGGIYVTDEAVGDCGLYCQNVADYLVKQHNVEIKTNARVTKLVKGSKCISALKIENSDEIECDHLVIAAGSGVSDLLKPLGINLGIYPVKGYSLTIPNTNNRPNTNISVREHFMVFAPLGDKRMRITAFKRFEGGDNQIDQVVVDDMKERITHVNPDLDLSEAVVKVGHRPMTADDMPVIRQSNRYSNLFLNCGHGAVGWTLSHSTSKLCSDLVMKSQ